MGNSAVFIFQPYLTMMHTLWMREHNTVASELKRFFPNWADERLFQEARKITTAEYQGIVYNEWLSFLLGYKSLGHYKGYKQCVDPSMCKFFVSILQTRASCHCKGL